MCLLENATGSDGATVYVLPNGTGAHFTAGRLAGGVLVDATLTLTVVNSEGDPIPDYPAADIWLVSTGGSGGEDRLVICGLANPGAATDANGQTQWVAPLFGGGSSLELVTGAVIATLPVPDTAEIHFVSADITGDLLINLSDITVFTQAIGTYDPRADFNNDQVVNLSDIAVFTLAIGLACP